MASSNMSRWKKQGQKKDITPGSPSPSAVRPEEDFAPITTQIPTDNLLDENFLQEMSFSKRGSMMLGGKKAVNAHARIHAGRRYDFSSPGGEYKC